MNWFDKNKFFEKLLIFTWVIFLFVCLFLLSFTAHAEGTADGSFPYKKSQILTYNSFMSNDILDALRNQNLPIDNDNYVLMYSDHSPYTQWPQYNNQYDVTYYFFLLPIEEFNSVSSGYNFYYNNLGVTLTSNSYYYYIGVTCDLTSSFDIIAVRTPSYTPYSTSLYNSGMFGHIPSVDSVSGFTFTPFSPVYFSKDFYSINDVLVLDYIEQSFVHPEGHATPPDPFDDVVVPSGHTLPHQVPTLTINNYSWTTAPSPDLSTLENTAESIYNYLSWLGSNLIGALSNIVTNIQNVGQFIGQTLQYYLGLILDAIKNSINTFYNNMVSLFEPIATAVNYITQPLDENVIYDNLNQTTFSSDISSVKTNFTAFSNQFNSISEPSTYKIPIHFESITMFSDVGVQYIDLGWLNSVKSLLRAFLWMVTTYGLIAAIFDAIPNYINGGGDESD